MLGAHLSRLRLLVQPRQGLASALRLASSTSSIEYQPIKSVLVANRGEEEHFYYSGAEMVINSHKIYRKAYLIPLENIMFRKVWEANRFSCYSVVCACVVLPLGNPFYQGLGEAVVWSHHCHFISLVIKKIQKQ